MIKFEWNEEKAATNKLKHGVSFLEATEIFADQLSLCVPDPDHSLGESRFLLFESSKSGGFLVVSFVEKLDRIRIVSARKMTKSERKAYEQ